MRPTSLMTVPSSVKSTLTVPMQKAHDRAQLKSTVTGPMPKAHIRAQLKSTSKLIASCTNHDSLPVTVAAAADHWHDSRARASGTG